MESWNKLVEDLPEGVTCSDQDLQAVLNEPKADLGEVCALSDAVNTDKRDAIRHPLLGRGER